MRTRIRADLAAARMRSGGYTPAPLRRKQFLISNSPNQFSEKSEKLNKCDLFATKNIDNHKKVSKVSERFYWSRHNVSDRSPNQIDRHGSYFEHDQKTDRDWFPTVRRSVSSRKSGDSLQLSGDLSVTEQRWGGDRSAVADRLQSGFQTCAGHSPLGLKHVCALQHHFITSVHTDDFLLFKLLSVEASELKHCMHRINFEHNKFYFFGWYRLTFLNKKLFFFFFFFFFFFYKLYSVVSVSKYIMFDPHRTGGNLKLLRESTNADWKRLKIAFLIANCRFRLQI